MKIVSAQLNPTVGDIGGNLASIIATATECHGRAELVVFPELFLTGYPPRDLLGESWFIEKVQAAIEELIRKSTAFGSIGVLFGAPLPSDSTTGRHLHNSALLIENGKLLFVQHKSLLPTYDVFDEARYFDPATSISIFEYKGIKLGISICEDAWNDPDFWPDRLYAFDPIGKLVDQGAEILINISASPFTLEKEAIRYRLTTNHAGKHGRPFIVVNQVGGNDELVFDGASLAVDKDGRLIQVSPSFVEHVQLIDTSASGTAQFQETPKMQSLHDALVLGIRDYVHKCSFKQVVVGLSGGIDSAVVACLAADALRAENVTGVAMPSMYTAHESTELARKLAENLGIRFQIVPIKPIYESYLATSGQAIKTDSKVSLALENLQARIRGNILMTISNQTGALVLSTGNKSEIATGYCTLYGDMAGGLAVISDVPKTMVYALARSINCGRETIPERIITRPPTAELKPNQVDQETLPPYETLDGILGCYLEERLSVEQIVARGFDRNVVQWVIRAVNRSEYKRRQAAPGLKVTSRAFGIGRRMPIAADLEQ